MPLLSIQYKVLPGLPGTVQAGLAPEGKGLLQVVACMPALLHVAAPAIKCFCCCAVGQASCKAQEIDCDYDDDYYYHYYYHHHYYLLLFLLTLLL